MMGWPSMQDTKTSSRISEITLPVTGMTCAGCAARVRKSLQAAAGVLSADVNFALDQARIATDADTSLLPEWVSAIRTVGFGILEDRFELAVSGMSCASCAATLEQALRKVPGVLEADVPGQGFELGIRDARLHHHDEGPARAGA